MLRRDAELHAPAPSYRTVHMQPLHRLARIRSFSSRAFRHPQLILVMKDQPYGVGDHEIREREFSTEIPWENMCLLQGGGLYTRRGEARANRLGE